MLHLDNSFFPNTELQDVQSNHVDTPNILLSNNEEEDLGEMETKSISNAGGAVIEGGSGGAEVERWCLELKKQWAQGNGTVKHQRRFPCVV